MPYESACCICVWTRAYRALGLDLRTPENRSRFRTLTQTRRLLGNSMRHVPPAQSVRANSHQLERMDGSRRGSLARAISDFYGGGVLRLGLDPTCPRPTRERQGWLKPAPTYESSCR